MARSRHGSSRRGRWLGFAAAFLATAWIGGFIVFAGSIPSETMPSDEQTDAIVVLTGGSLRLETGLALLEDGAARKLFVSGVHRGVDVAQLMRLQEMDPGRWDCCIALGHDAVDTVGNAEETAGWAAVEGVTSIRLVTAGYHMPRSLLEFRAAMLRVGIVPHPVSPEHVKHDDWYRYPGTTFLIAGEFTKYLLAWLRQTVDAVVGSVRAAA